MKLPLIIQGGMGVGVSNWRLARAVSMSGQLGVVSGTAIDQVMARRLQDGDPDGNVRRALSHFPVPAISERILREFYIHGGKTSSEPYRKIPPPAHDAKKDSVELHIAANFVEVFLAREGHDNPVGINYLEKIQAPHLPSIYGAMLAGVRYVLMGAGIPLRIPGVLDSFVKHGKAEYPFQVSGGNALLTFNPVEYVETRLPDLARPAFLAIVASNTLATTLLKKANGRVDGFIVEGSTAGGHNAPPRGQLQLSNAGEPVYGERDRVDLARLKELGVPFWLAGGFGSSEGLREALDAGATGIQVGTAFEFCRESGLRDDYKLGILEKIAGNRAAVFTDPVASPTGFPFKVVAVEDTASAPGVYQARPRVCDLGYLREAYMTDSGAIGYRCSGEPMTVYVSKGGKEENTSGRKCLCNGLLANIGHPQVRNKYVEPGLVTAGDDLASIKRFLPAVGCDYFAGDVVGTIIAGCRSL